MTYHRVGESHVTVKMAGLCLCIEVISMHIKGLVDISPIYFLHFSHYMSHLVKEKTEIMYPQTVLKLRV